MEQNIDNNSKKIWLKEQEEFILQTVKQQGPRKWNQMAKKLNQIFGEYKKTGQRCRQRYYNKIDPNLQKKGWGIDQQDILFQQHKKLGSKWSVISQKLIGRSHNCIKNHFYSLIRKSLRRVHKFLGSKKGTSFVKQLKPSILSNIFTIIQKETNPQQSISNQANNQLYKYKQTAYNMINFSRQKLCDKRTKISKQDSQKLQRILAEVIKLNNNLYNKKQVNELSQRIKSPQAKPALLDRIKYNGNNEIYFNMEDIQSQGYYQNINNSQKCSYSNSEQQKNEAEQIQDQQKQDSIQPTQFQNNYNFSVEILQNTSQNNNLISQSPWLNMTPYIITPSLNKKQERQICFNQQAFDQITQKLVNQIKKNTAVQQNIPVYDQNQNTSKSQIDINFL